MCSTRKNQIPAVLLIRLIILSFIFTFPSAQPLEWNKTSVEKYSQIEKTSDVAVLKSTTETRLLKRIPFLETLIHVDRNIFSINKYSLTETFFDYKISLISYDLQSAQARAPPFIS